LIIKIVWLTLTIKLSGREKEVFGVTMTPGENVSEIDYGVAGRRYVGTYVPAVAPSRALAVLLPDWRGRSCLALDHAAHLAGLGCVTLVADLYGDGYSPTDPGEVAPMVQHLLEHRAEGVAALSAAVAALRLAAGAPQLPLLVVAYSAGAVVALDHGRRTQEPAAIVVCSGLLRTAEPGTPTRVPAPILLIQGSRDEVSPMPVIAGLVAEADAAGNDLRLMLLADTHHAFDNPDAGSDPTARLVYSSRSAARARMAIANMVDEIVATGAAE
jgi:dienelactone hydrolase